MNTYIKVGPYHKILEIVRSTSSSYGGEGFFPVSDIPEGSTHYYEGMFLTAPPAPSEFHVWKEETFTWEVSQASIDEAKQVARDHINKARDAARNSGFEAFGKTFDSDEASRTNIIFASQAANILPEDFTINWTCADNSQITLSKAQLLQLPVFLVSAGNVIHQRALELKAQIDAANTLEEINAVTW